jgi:hypothetical protein
VTGLDDFMRLLIQLAFYFALGVFLRQLLRSFRDVSGTTSRRGAPEVRGRPESPRRLDLEDVVDAEFEEIEDD